MANYADIQVENDWLLTIVPQNVSFLSEYTDNNGNKTYSVVLRSGESKVLTNEQYELVKGLDYSGGGGGEGAIQSDTISNMEFANNKLTIDGTEFKGGTDVIYNTTTNVLSGIKDQSGRPTTLNVRTITITY